MVHEEVASRSVSGGSSLISNKTTTNFALHLKSNFVIIKEW